MSADRAEVRLMPHRHSSEWVAFVILPGESAETRVRSRRHSITCGIHGRHTEPWCAHEHAALRAYLRERTDR